MTTYGYARCSSKKQLQEDKYSLPVQTSKIYEYCEKNKLVVHEPLFVDAGISGKKFSNRKQMQEMKNIIKKGDKIITYSISRVSRNNREFLNFVDELQNKEVTLIIIEEDIDLSTSTGRFYMRLKSNLAQLESDQIGDRVKATMLDMKQKGILRTKPKFGYQMIDKKLVPHEEEQFIIRIIKKLIDNDPNITTAEITRFLQDRCDKGEISIRKSVKIYHNVVQHIIRDNNLKPLHI